MSQLVADEVTALGGDPVDNTTDASGTVVEQPDVSTEGDLYPDDQPAQEGGEGEQPTEEEYFEPEEPAIEAPNSWKSEDKEAWSDIPRAAQEVIARREAEFQRGMTEKGKEVQAARDKALDEVKGQAVQELVAYHEQNAAKLAAFAQLVMPEEPDRRLLYSQDPEHRLLYQQQKAIFDDAQSQLGSLQAGIEEHWTAAQRMRATREKEVSDAQLRQALPQWFADDADAVKLRSDVKSIADELGYGDHFEEANARDIFALRKVAELKAEAEANKADAQKWRSYEKNRPRDQQGRYRPHRQLPPVTKPGSAMRSGQQGQKTVEQLLYPND